VARRARRTAAGKTFHLVDRADGGARGVRASPSTPAPKPRGHPAAARARRAAHARAGPARPRPLAFLDLPPRRTTTTNTAQALAGTSLRCPPLADYLPVLVRYVLDLSRSAAPPVAEEVSDPLDET
jgi:hypothetical protein